MDEEEKGALTIGDFFKVLFRRKWIILAVTLAALIVGTLIIELAVNPARITYQMYFTMEYPGKSSVYPDGTTFRFQDMVSLEYMQAVKDSDEQFANIDVEKISENDGVTINSTSVLKDDDTSSSSLTTNEKLYEYWFVAEAKYFPDADTANAFLRALAAYPAEYTKTSLEKVSFTKNLLSYDSDSVKRYEEKLNILNNQYNYLVGQYEALISSFGDNLVINEKSLSVWLNELQTAYGSYDRESLNDRLSRYGYTFTDKVFDETTDDLVHELQINTKAIENDKDLYTQLVGTSGTTAETTLLTKISELEARNENILYTLNFRGITVDESDANLWTWTPNETSAAYINFTTKSEEFGKELDKIKITLEEQAVICKDVVAAAYGQQSRVLFASSKLEEIDSIGIIMAVIISLLIGLVASAVVVLIVDMPAYSRNKKKAYGIVTPDFTKPVKARTERELSEAAVTEDKADENSDGGNI